jgi:hypothetical protein
MARAQSQYPAQPMPSWGLLDLGASGKSPNAEPLITETSQHACDNSKGEFNATFPDRTKFRRRT